MKIKKFQLRGNNSICAGAFQLLRGRAPVQLRRNVVLRLIISLQNILRNKYTLRKSINPN
jgi:hypothetical protein